MPPRPATRRRWSRCTASISTATSWGRHWWWGEDALAIARTALGPDFGDEPPSDDAARHDAAVRFYLFTLKGWPT